MLHSFMGRVPLLKVRHGCHKLRRRERFREHDAVRRAFGGLICGGVPAHINEGKCRVDLSGVPGSFPNTHFAFQIDVGHVRVEFILINQSPNIRFLRQAGSGSPWRRRRRPLQIG